MKQKNIFIAAAAALITVFVAGALFYNQQKTDAAAQLAAKNQIALARPHAPTIGNANAPVHIVEFFDPACETCRTFHPLVKKMMEANPGKIRLSLRYAPFHPGSADVVKVIEAARKQGQFQTVLEALFAAQDVWVINHAAQLPLIWAPLSALGLDMDRLKTDMNAPAVADLIAQDLRDATTLNVTKTPEYFVNGKPLPRFGYDQLKKLVDDALASTGQK